MTLHYRHVMVRPDKNLLLAQLNAADFGQVVPWLSLIQLNALEVLHDKSEPIQTVYFPVGAVIAKYHVCHCGLEHYLLRVSEGGMVGMAAIGDGISAWKAQVEKAGPAYSMSLKDFQGAIEHVMGFRQMVVRETLMLTEQFMRQAAMNELNHSRLSL